MADDLLCLTLPCFDRALVRNRGEARDFLRSYLRHVSKAASADIYVSKNSVGLHQLILTAQRI